MGQIKLMYIFAYFNEKKQVQCTKMAEYYTIFYSWHTPNFSLNLVLQNQNQSEF